MAHARAGAIGDPDSAAARAPVEPAASSPQDVIPALSGVSTIPAKEPSGFALDGEDNVHLSGNTTSPDFPVTPDAPQPIHNGGRDGRLSKLSSDLSQLVYSSYLGGNGDCGRCLAFNVLNEAVVGGDTDSPNLPVTPGSAMVTYMGGAADGFVSLERHPERGGRLVQDPRPRRRARFPRDLVLRIGSR